MRNDSFMVDLVGSRTILVILHRSTLRFLSVRNETLNSSIENVSLLLPSFAA